jgi:hypothetical protein
VKTNCIEAKIFIFAFLMNCFQSKRILTLTPQINSEAARKKLNKNLLKKISGVTTAPSSQKLQFLIPSSLNQIQNIQSKNQKCWPCWQQRWQQRASTQTKSQSSPKYCN